MFRIQSSDRGILFIMLSWDMGYNFLLSSRLSAFGDPLGNIKIEKGIHFSFTLEPHCQKIFHELHEYISSNIIARKSEQRYD